MEVRPAGPPHKGAENGGDEIQAHDHIQKPQVEVGLTLEHLPQGRLDTGPAQPRRRHLGHQSIGRPPHRQGHQHPQNVAEKQLGGGEAVLGVQQEHSGQHDKDGHTPVGQPVVGIQHMEFRRAHRHVAQLGARQVDHNHRQHGHSPQQVGIGQTASRYGLAHVLIPFRGRSRSSSRRDLQ